MNLRCLACEMREAAGSRNFRSHHRHASFVLFWKHVLRTLLEISFFLDEQRLSIAIWCGVVGENKSGAP